MTRRSVVAVVAAFALTAGLSGCATTAPGAEASRAPLTTASATSAPTEEQLTDVEYAALRAEAIADLVDWTPDASAAADRPGYPCDHDPAESQPFGCTAFESVGGTMDGEDLPWLGLDPLRITFAPMNGSITMVLGTPCNAVNIQVVVGAGTLQPDTDRMTVSLMLCTGPRGAAEAWATDVVSRPMTYVLDDETLVLTSGTDEITFVAVERPTS